MQKYFDTNRSLWDQKTQVHIESKLYDVPAFKSGKTSLKPIELALLEDLKDKKILHLQCHFGQDTLSFARMGAQATGVDFSGEAIKVARQLNKELDLDVTFIECNVYDLTNHLEGEFDIIFASYGFLPWLPDIQKWADIAHHFLKKSGHLYLVEFHPTLNMFDWYTHEVCYDYFHKKQPYEETLTGTYADPSADLEHKEYFWMYSIHEVMQAFLQLDMQLLDFQEYDYSPYDVFGKMRKLGEDKYIYGKQNSSFPHVYSMIFKK